MPPFGTAEIDAETLGALSAAARKLVPPTMDVDVCCREGYLQVIVGLKPRGPSWGGARLLRDFSPTAKASAQQAEWIAGAVRDCVDGLVAQLLRPAAQVRDAARQRWRQRDTMENAEAYREACREVDEERLRLLGMNPLAEVRR